MKTSNPLLDNLIEAQTQAINNWVDSTKKVQSAFLQGNISTEGQSIYKDLMDKQITLFNGMQTEFKNSSEALANHKPEEFFKNWYAQQMDQIKKMTDFNQGIYTNVSNLGKPAADYINNLNNFNSASNTWNNVYTTWMNSFNSNQNMFQNNFSNPFNKDAFKNIFETNQVFNKLKEFWEPAFKSMQGGNFSPENFKKLYTTENYKELTEQMFGQFFNNNNMKELFDSSIKNIQNFFGSNNNLSKEFFTQMENMSKEFPQMVSGDFAKLSGLFQNVNNVFSKTFEPIMKLTTPGKEKEAIENNIILLDKVAEFYVRQSQLQHQLYTAAQKSFETAAKASFEKLGKDADPKASFNEFYNEWIKINEGQFTDLFSSDEFSKVKAEVTGLGMDVKKYFEKQFESTFATYPFVFKSELEELHKTIYDLKKTIKDLQGKSSLNGSANHETEEDKLQKAAKRK